MRRRTRLTLNIVCAVAVTSSAFSCRASERAQPTATAGDERSGMLQRGARADFVSPGPVSDPIRGEERPLICNAQIADLDGDGLPDVLVCDVLRNRITWIRQSPRGVFTESAVGDPIQAPAHVEAIDFDK